MIEVISPNPISERERRVLREVEELVDQRREGDPHRLRQDHEAVALEPAECERLGGLDLALVDRLDAAADDLGDVGRGVEHQRRHHRGVRHLHADAALVHPPGIADRGPRERDRATEREVGDRRRSPTSVPRPQRIRWCGAPVPMNTWVRQYPTAIAATSATSTIRRNVAKLSRPSIDGNANLALLKMNQSRGRHDSVDRGKAVR